MKLSRIRPDIRRHETALYRKALSRPLAQAFQDNLIRPTGTVFDYGCGRGEDLRQLEKLDVNCRGWDPIHRPNSDLTSADVVNLGYVVNVIEDRRERNETLKKAWRLTGRLLIVSARIISELRDEEHEQFSDGIITSRKTFQKFFQQSELRDWIDETLSVHSVPAAPGIYYVFRDDDLREQFVASRYRRRNFTATIRKSDAIFDANRKLFEPLVDFLMSNGRRPRFGELAETQALSESVGSLNVACRIAEVVLGKDQITEVRNQRRDDLIVYLAISKFAGRQKLSDLPNKLQGDVKDFFGSYKKAADIAENLLFALGDLQQLEADAQQSLIGRNSLTAFYAHVSALEQLPISLRIYEACARTYLGEVESAEVIKFGLTEPKITYLSYDDFENKPHPILTHTLRIHLQTFRIKERDFSSWDDPPVLHKKNELVAPDHPKNATFVRLTKQEVRWGMYDYPDDITTHAGWKNELRNKGVELRGHRLIKISN